MRNASIMQMAGRIFVNVFVMNVGYLCVKNSAENNDSSYASQHRYKDRVHTMYE